MGRALTKSWNGGEAITYVYNPVNRMIKSISSSNGTGKRFEYDELNRLKTRVDSIDNNNKFTASYSYLSTGEIGNVVLNSAVTMSYEYNTYGYVDQVRTNNQLVWDANSVNEYGIVNNFTLGNQAVTSIDYDSYGFVDEITTIKNGTDLQNWSYDFNNITGNLTSRMGLNSSGGSVTESFTYDDLNRLLTCTAGQDTLSVSYDGSGYGNITGKTDVGTYDYTGGVHKVTSVTNPTVLMQNRPKQHIEYTKFNKVGYIRDSLNTGAERELFITYGPDQQRVKTLYKEDGIDVKTKYFALGQYEKETDSTGNVRELYYISGADGVVAAFQRMNEQDSIFYISKDNLGSFDVITNPDGSVKERYNYDPWGRRRNPTDWSYNNVPEEFFLDRGFTGHEHLDKFELINMNGRVYDQVIAMFLSPDNFVQSPDLTQNFNRYTYCLNNPLKFTDPSGNNYMQLLDMAYEGNPIKNYGGGTWWGNDLQIPYPEDFIGIDGGIYSSLSAPGSNYQKWISSPSLQNKYSSFEDYNSAQGYYVYVDHGGEVTNEKYIINTNGGYIEITLPTIDIITEKIWISTSDTGLSVGGGNGFNVADNILGGAGLINGLAGFDAGLSSKHTYRYAQRVNGKIVSAAELTAQNQAKALKVLNASKSFGKILGGAGGLVIAGDVLYNSEIKASHGLNAIMTGIAFTGWGAPVAGIWFVADFGTGLFTGRSISDRLDLRVGGPLVDW